MPDIDTRPRNILVFHCEHSEHRKSLLLTQNATITAGSTITIGAITYTVVNSFSSPAVPNQILTMTTSLGLIPLIAAINGKTHYGSTQVASVGTIKNPAARAFLSQYQFSRAFCGIGAEFPDTEPAYSYSGPVGALTPSTGDAVWAIRDTAQYQYDNSYKFLSETVDEWVENDYETHVPPGCLHASPLDVSLPVAAKLAFGDYMPFNVIHVGLDPETGIITPYIASGEYGEFVGDKCENEYYDGIYVDNENGFMRDTFQDGDGERASHSPLLDEIFHSEYFAEWVDPGLVYDINVEKTVDFVILAPPQAYCLDAYPSDYRDSTNSVVLSTPISIGTREIERAVYQSRGTVETWKHMHEYMHVAKRELLPGGWSLRTKEVFADGDDIILLSNITPGATVACMSRRPTIPMTIPDIYMENNGRLPPAPWGSHPALWCNTFNSRGVTYVLHPLIAASLGFTDLNRFITASGTYTIQNMLDTMDVVCIMSPYDNNQVVMLNVFYPVELGGSTNYYGSGSARKGVYASVWLKQLPSYSNWGNIAYISTYMVDTCCEYWSYGDIGTQEYRVLATLPGQNFPNAKLVLIDRDKVNNSGLALDNDPFGVKVEFVEWTFPEGIPTATVIITIDPPAVVLSPPAVAVDSETITDISAAISWDGEEGTYCELEFDTADTFGGDYPARRCAYRIDGSAITLLSLLRNTQYFLRVRRGTDTLLSEWSTVVDFTTLALHRHVVNSESGAMRCVVDMAAWFKKIYITLRRDGLDPIVIEYPTLPGLSQEFVLPMFMETGEATVEYAFLRNASSPVDVVAVYVAGDVVIKKVGSPRLETIMPNESLEIVSVETGWTMYLCGCAASGDINGVWALAIKDGVGKIYDQLTARGGYVGIVGRGPDALILPDGSTFGIDIRLVVPPSAQRSAAVCHVCYGET